MTRALNHLAAGLLATAVLTVPAAAQPESAAQPTDASAFKNRAPVAKETLRVSFPKAKAWTLPNGLRLLVLEDRELPTVAFNLSILAGSFFEPLDKQGLASMTASMLDEGTKTMSSAELASAVDRLGATLGANAEQGGERAGVYASGFSTDTDEILALMRDIVRNPTFPEDQLAKVKDRTVAGLTQGLQDPGTLAEVATARAMYGTAPPARVFPPMTQVKALGRDDLAAFHGRYYRPERAILGVVGDVKADDILRKVRAAFGDWERGSGPLLADLPEFRPATQPRVLLVDRPGSVQSLLRLGNLAIRRTDDDYPALTVMNRILGGGSSISSRLGRNIREEKGYTYDVYSTFDTPRYLGTWHAGTEVRNAVASGTLTEFVNEFRKIREESVTERELASAKRGIIGRFALRMESPETLLAMAMELEEFGLPADYWNRFPARIEAVTAEDVRRVAAKYLDPRGLQVIAVGERSQLEEALKPFGPLEVLDLAAALS